jgi:hypothetical protein
MAEHRRDLAGVRVPVQDAEARVAHRLAEFLNAQICPLPDQDRKETWRFRRYSDGFAMDF